MEASTPLFFFSSRRRHTRWTGDWSSDVCSSDLDKNMEVGNSLLIQTFTSDINATANWPNRLQVELCSHRVWDVNNQCPSSIEIGRASCRERVESWVGASGLWRKRRRHRR